MFTRVVIINAYEPNDFFAATLAKEYDNQLSQQDTPSVLLFISNMFFSKTAFPERYSYENLESDLQKSVDYIKAASTLTFFVSVGAEGLNPAFQAFVNRLFHLEKGRINEKIWGNITAYTKKVRIITILNDETIWQQFKQDKKGVYHPINKIDFKLFGVSEIYTTTFGFLKENVINDYAKKCIQTLQELAKKDT